MATTLALSTNGSGYANKTSATGISSGNFDFSWAMWYNATVTPTSLYVLCSFGGPDIANEKPYFWYNKSGATYRLSEDFKSNNVDVNLAGALSNTWHHLVQTYTASSKTTEIWVDGASIGSGVHPSGTLNIVGSEFAVAASAADHGGLLVGYLQDVRYYQSVLTAGNIASLYNSGNGTYDVVGTTVGWWKLNGDYTDSSGNGNTLTAQGSGNSFVTGKIVTGTATDANFLGAGL